MHLPLEVREKVALLPESPSREELYVLWTNLLQRHFPFPLRGSLPNLPDLPDETEAEPKEEWHLAELQATLKEEMMKSSHCHIARGRGMTIHGAIVVGREAKFYK
ncbi:uncharacterized protein Aud_005102 [Aspergillus udagawae]|uniref:Uncharacterized protein n=1 Tax=Aspergillus udagawae TaxID=91492 RepID=A0A8E0QPH3_9EURO|nr:uncharacterized protein Aud_005102 [Aspergillus udagawae]GIC88704.1 hypothetical protein Aud_005102 [Aspergillus udagawae]